MVEEIKKQDQVYGKKKEPEAEAKEEVKPTEAKKAENKVISKRINKDYALVNGKNISMSPKESGHICDMIRYKNVDRAIKMIEEVLVFKRPVKMTSREYPHQHGKGIAGASYPLNAAKEFLKSLKQLKANAIYNELDLENYIIICKADKASRPYRRGGSRFKRTNLMLKLIKNDRVVKKKLNKNENKKSEKEIKEVRK
jgi:ribosomal protein L22